jgi:hypothetical protein
MLRKCVLPIFVLTVLFGSVLCAQNLAGTWQGALQGGSHDLPLAFTVTKADTVDWKGSMTSGDNTTFSVPVAVVMIDSSNFKFVVPSLGGTYEARISSHGNFMVGIWKRYGHEMPLVLKRGTL